MLCNSLETSDKVLLKGKSYWRPRSISKWRLKKPHQNMHPTGLILSTTFSSWDHITFSHFRPVVLGLSTHVIRCAGQVITPQQTPRKNLELLVLKIRAWCYSRSFHSFFFQQMDSPKLLLMELGTRYSEANRNRFTDPQTKSVWIPWVCRQTEKHWAKENILLAVSSTGDITSSPAVLILPIQGRAAHAHVHAHTRTCIIALLWGLGLI